jgi:hypothetical protein
MTLTIAQLITVYVILAAILAGLNIYALLSWRIKSLMLALTSAAYLVIYFSFAPLLGWPGSGDLPARFNLVSLYAQEPDPRGDIFFWVTDKTTNSNIPRAYQVDFEPQLHARAIQAMQRKNKSIPQTGTMEPDLELSGVAKEQRKGHKTQKFHVKFSDDLPEAAPTKTDLPASGDEVPADMLMPPQPTAISPG